MAKTLSDNALDAAFDYIAGRADLMALCAGAPANATEATAVVSAGGRQLASASLVEGLGGNDFAAGAGQVSGRRLVVAAQASVPVTEAGTIDHLALVDSTGGELLSVTELTESQIVAAGEIISVRAFSANIQAPV